jgi:hypothetical protein
VRARACTLYMPLPGRFSTQGAAGPNTVRFSGRLRGARLRPGHYRLSARPTDSAGNAGSTRRAGFTITSPHA